MLRKIRILITLLALVLTRQALAMPGQTIKVGVHNNPPLCSIDSSKQAQGIFIDIINEVAAINRWKVQYVPLSFAEGIKAIQYGKVDLLTTVARTKEREKTVYFNSESIFTNWGIVYSTKSVSIESITDLEGKVLALEKSDIHARALTLLLKDFNVKANIVWCDNINTIFKKLRNNEVDAGAVNKIFGYQQNLDQQLRATPIIFNPVNIHIAGGPLSRPLLNDLDQALLHLKTTHPAFYQNTINQWLSKEAKTGPQWIYNSLYTLLVLTIILSIILFFQRNLVKKRTNRLHEAEKIGKQRAKAIRQIEHEKALILNSLEEQVIFIDNDYNLVWANDAFKKSHDVPFEKLVGKKCYAAYFNRNTPCNFCQYDNCLKTNRTEVREHISNTSGKIFTHKTHPVYDADQNPIGFVEILSDITDKKKHEEELVAAKEKAEQSDYLKSAFLANMSHEIRTPMNAIIGFSELLDDDSLTSAERKSYLNIIQSNGNQLLKLISDILIFSQIESGHIELQYSTIKIMDFLESIYQQFESEVSKLNKRLTIHLLAEIEKTLEMDTDIVRLKQVIFNLLTNAIKFTDEGSITLGASRRKNTLIIFVKDTGIGIPHNQQEEVFKRFSQVSNNQMRKASGSGLGLTIANDLSKQLGGHITLESTPGYGSTFYLHHPLRRTQHTDNKTLHKIPVAPLLK